MTYYAPNKFSSLLFSPGTLNGDVDNNCGLTSFANCHLWPRPALILLPTTKTPSIFIFLSRRLLHCQPCYLYCTLDLELNLHTFLTHISWLLFFYSFFVVTFHIGRERERENFWGWAPSIGVCVGSTLQQGKWGEDLNSNHWYSTSFLHLRCTHTHTHTHTHTRRHMLIPCPVKAPAPIASWKAEGTLVITLKSSTGP